MLTSIPDDRKRVLKEEKYNATNFQTLWNFEGVFKYSPLFYGWYTYKEGKKGGYRLPFAYFITGLVAYAYSFVATLRKMAENSRMSKLSEKDDECIFTWKLLTAWDYMIGNAETAHNRIASIVVGFKEALLEEAEKKREARNWKITGFRILVNLIVLALLFISAFAVVLVVKRSTEPEAARSVWRSNEITFVMIFISTSFPMIFEGLGFLEQYHPRKQLRLQLARIMILYLLNLYSLIFALFDKINDMTPELESFKRNLTRKENTSLQAYSAEMQCYDICNSESDTLKAFNLVAAIAANLSTTVLPIMQNVGKNSSDEPDYEFTNTENFAGNYTDETMENLTFLSLTTEEDGYDPLKNILNAISDAPVKLRTELTTQTPETTSTERSCQKVCVNVTIQQETTTQVVIIDESGLNYTTRKRLRNLCWETMFGQELIKLTVMDLAMTIISSLGMDFLRGAFVRVMNPCWCWDLEKKFPEYADFKVAENILHLVNNQGLVWMGMFFSPGLIPLNVIKLLILMYFKCWIVLTCNIPHEVIFRASKSNNFYYALLLMMLFLCVLPVGYAIVRIPPSSHCGPFSKYSRIFHIFTKTLKENVPPVIEDVLDYIASPGIIIPLLLLLVLIIYYLLSLTSALREANADLKIQLRRERTEERRKLFRLADKRRRGGSSEFANTPFGKWKKLLQTMPSNGKSFDDTTKHDSNDHPLHNEPKAKEILARFIKKTLRKTSTSEDDHETPNQEDGTDTEQHDSLPEDISLKETRMLPQRVSISSGSFDYPKILLQKRNSQKSISESSDKQKNVAKPERGIRQDSNSSVWSDNIPVITISKTESAEYLDTVPEISKTTVECEAKFKPKIKCVLKKQSTEVDEDVICHFSKDLDLSFGFEERDMGGVSESSEDTLRESSTDTVIQQEKEDEEKIGEVSTNGSATESSAEYNDINSL